MITTKVFASAGCGKTTWLLNRVDALLESGVPPEKILFTTFTRAGAYEARDRAVERFNYHPNRFLWFRTLHSAAFRILENPPIMGFRDYVHIGRVLGCRFGSLTSNDFSDRGKGDALMGLYDYQRNMDGEGHLNPSDFGINVSQREYAHFIETYQAYKDSTGKFDYTDLITEIAVSGEPLAVDYVFLDEAQDMTALQYRAVRRLAEGCKEFFMAGDDDQAIYEYSGADPKILVGEETTHKVLLMKSYRLPPAICSFANSISGKIKYREPKNIEPVPRDLCEKGDKVIRANSLEQVDFDSRPTVVLVRNRMFAEHVAEILFAKGLPFQNDCGSDDRYKKALATWTWTRCLSGDTLGREEIIQMALILPCALWRRQDVKRFEDSKLEQADWALLAEDFGLLAQHSWDNFVSYGPSLKSYVRMLEKTEFKNPPVRITTIHQFKGKEAEHVIVKPDMTWQTYNGFSKAPDREHRVFFTAVSRAKETLTLLAPTTNYWYNF